MTIEDFLDRWLVIWTESKDSESLIKPPYKDENKEERPTLGQKGVGRLAIAIIGPQTLILSHAERENSKFHDLVVCFINWRLFEIPGINLEDITIPVKTFKSGTLPTNLDFHEMVSIVRKMLKPRNLRAVNLNW